MDFIEVTGKDVNEAIMNAAQKLETPSNELEYEVLENGSAGFLGIGKKPAKIKVRKKVQEEVENVKPAKEVKESKPVSSKPSFSSKSSSVSAASPAKREEKEVKEIKEVKDDSSKSRVKADISEEQVKNVVNKFLGDVFKAMNMEVTIDATLDREEECVNVNLSGEEMGLLIGKRGQTLDSLQYLLRLVVNKEIGGYLKVKIDTEDYRNRRKETLESLAKNIAFKVKRSRTSVELEPMNPYERRIIHSALQNDKYVATKSEGEEPYRHIVVYLKKPYYGGSSYGNKRYNKPYNKNYGNKNYKSYRNNRENKEAAVTENTSNAVNTESTTNNE